jgi:hypothetical protein
MAIQFQCPSCNQPIEVDDEWATKPVACPYCSKTVTAPESSTIGGGPPPPVALPADVLRGQPDVGARGMYGPAPSPSAFAQTVQPEPAGSNAYAPWALALSCAAAVLYFGLSFFVAAKVTTLAGPGATVEEAQKAMVERIQGGDLPGWLAVAAAGFILTLLVWLVALVLCILAVRRPARRGLTIVGFVVCAIIPAFICLNVIVGVSWAIPAFAPGAGTLPFCASLSP